jgi:hypothetical protein
MYKKKLQPVNGNKKKVNGIPGACRSKILVQK